MVSRLALLPPMSRSEIEELPEELQKIFLVYIVSLNKAISMLLHARDDEEFERNFKDVMLELFKYCASLELALSEERLNLILKNYLAFFSQTGFTIQGQTPLVHTVVQVLDEASRVIANFVRLVLEPDYRDHVPNHPDALGPYMELLAYTAILIYIRDKSEADIEQSMVEKIITKCQETTWKVESYVDTIEIDADHEATAALERAKQMSF
jgi:hypothetical protein